MRIIPTGRRGATGPPGPAGPAGFGNPAYGELILVGNAVPDTLTLQNIYYPVGTGWTLDEFLNFTATASALKAVLLTGEYLTICTLAFTSAEAPQTVEFQLHKNGNPILDHKAISWLDTMVYPNTVTLSGLDKIAVDDVIDLRARCTTAAGQVLTITDANLSLAKIAP